jgi:hypothetical protein
MFENQNIKNFLSINEYAIFKSVITGMTPQQARQSRRRAPAFFAFRP